MDCGGFDRPLTASHAFTTGSMSAMEIYRQLIERETV
jgi:hypothetical protein